MNKKNNTNKCCYPSYMNYIYSTMIYGQLSTRQRRDLRQTLVVIIPEEDKNKSHSDQMFNTEIDHSTFTSTPNQLMNIPAQPSVHNIVNTTPEESLGQTERGEAAIAKDRDSYRLD